MQSINNNKYSLLEKMLESLKNNKKLIQELLEKIMNKSIADIKFLGIENFDSIIEYKFSLFKMIVTYKDSRQEQIYVKTIKAGKIKESIFCYWSFIYEEYYKKNKEKSNNNMHKKTIISQNTIDESDINITLKSENVLDYSAEISLIELYNFAEKNMKSVNTERWLEELEIEDDEILFIGKKRY